MFKTVFASVVMVIIAAVLLFYGQTPASEVHADSMEFDVPDAECFGLKAESHFECNCEHGWMNEERLAAMDHSRIKDYRGTSSLMLTS